MDRVNIRPLAPADLPVLADIYRSSIQTIGPGEYTPEQIAAWSAHADDAEGFAAWIAKAYTLVAVDEMGVPLGFCGLEPEGRIASLFVAPAAMRRGIGSRLLKAILAEAQRREMDSLRTEASEFSRPVFERFGFAVDHVEHVAVRGVEFSRYVMRLEALDAPLQADGLPS